MFLSLYFIILHMEIKTYIFQIYSTYEIRYPGTTIKSQTSLYQFVKIKLFYITILSCIYIILPFSTNTQPGNSPNIHIGICFFLYEYCTCLQVCRYIYIAFLFVQHIPNSPIDVRSVSIRCQRQRLDITPISIWPCCCRLSSDTSIECGVVVHYQTRRALGI